MLEGDMVWIVLALFLFGVATYTVSSTAVRVKRMVI